MPGREIQPTQHFSRRIVISRFACRTRSHKRRQRRWPTGAGSTEPHHAPRPSARRHSISAASESKIPGRSRKISQGSLRAFPSKTTAEPRGCCRVDRPAGKGGAPMSSERNLYGTLALLILKRRRHGTAPRLRAGASHRTGQGSDCAQSGHALSGVAQAASEIGSPAGEQMPGGRPSSTPSPGADALDAEAAGGIERRPSSRGSSRACRGSLLARLRDPGAGPSTMDRTHLACHREMQARGMTARTRGVLRSGLRASGQGGGARGSEFSRARDTMVRRAMPSDSYRDSRGSRLSPSSHRTGHRDDGRLQRRQRRLAQAAAVPRSGPARGALSRDARQPKDIQGAAPVYVSRPWPGVGTSDSGKRERGDSKWRAGTARMLSHGWDVIAQPTFAPNSAD